MTLREKVLLILREYDKDQNLTDPDTADRILALVAEDRRELKDALDNANQAMINAFAAQDKAEAERDTTLAVLRGCVELIASAGPLAWIANENWDGARSWEVASDSILVAARKLLEEEET